MLFQVLRSRMKFLNLGLILTVGVATGLGSISWAKKKEEPKKAPAVQSLQQYRTHVTEVVVKHVKDFRACKKSSNPNHGRMVIAWEMDETGKPRNFTRGEDTTESEPFFHCMSKKIQSWNFKAPPDGRPMDVEHLFML